MSMSNQVTSHLESLPGLSTAENTFRVLQETLYPGSTDSEVMMILGYCKARRIDPILKPVHLVPMSVKTDKKDKDGKYVYERKNVIMPGIGLYRIDASRTGKYAGISEPEFGEDVTEKFGKKGEEKNVTYPRWCKITVKKILEDGSIAEFHAKEYWKENYSTKSKWDECPNDMWEKRAYGQLAKCTEAQALRKAFPDVVGNEHIKEEMEGKLFDHTKEKSRTFDGKTVNQATHEHLEAKHAIPEPTIDEMLKVFDSLTTSKDLQENFKNFYKILTKNKDKDGLAKLIAAKDALKVSMEYAEGASADATSATADAKVNPETGEVL